MTAYYIGCFFIIVHTLVVDARLFILLSSVDISDLTRYEAVKIIEGDQLLLNCTSNDHGQTVSWKRNNETILNNTLKIDHIGFRDAGEYICKTLQSYAVEERSVSVEVMYGPSYPIIKGETSGINGEEVNLKCVSDAFPSPSYTWRRENQNGVLLSRDQTYRTKINKDISGVVCIVKSQMIPTLGNSKTVTTARRTVIRGYEKANIKSVENMNGNNWNVIEGDDVDIHCVTSGEPAPTVWWTKVGNSSFFFEGDRLQEHKTDKSFEGYYTCHATNTVMSIKLNNTLITTNTFKTIKLEVIVSSAPDDNCTPEVCLSHCENSLHVATNQENSTQRIGQDTLGNQTDSIIGNKELLLVVANGAGWLAFIACLCILIVCHVRRRRKNETQSLSASESDESVSSVGYAYARSLSGSYISEVRLPGDTYTELYEDNRLNQSRAGERQSVRTMQSNDTYLKPFGSSYLYDLQTNTSVSNSTSLTSFGHLV